MSLDALFDALACYRETDNLWNVYYFNSSNRLHRINGPAVEYVTARVNPVLTRAWLNEAAYPDAVKRYLSEHNET